MRGVRRGVEQERRLALKLLPMANTIDTAAARNEIRSKIVELASRTTLKKPVLRDDDVIPETGLLDAGTTRELVGWLETRFGVEIDQRDLTIENFGTVNAIVHYLASHARPMA